ncbi:YaeQ family protein [Paralcaligenes sp. KSB-10]|uniref:YaeQ family protein n=1 Tax=Paralcaligenes sp. KSB-10 TaxID=2901142 RepID=UPI001E50799A|nr:YaeQ family protein [Paralcaligenes sp. KSB-10]UHL64943.1 YaeQ family protein [Paralcaligenes sp. KSB-10]
MALRATIFKLELHIADMVRGYYNSHVLTLARHPSETEERLMLRILVFALLADEQLVFTRGLSIADEPALWQKDLTGLILNWVDLGHPDERRLLQASGKSAQVTVCCYGGSASQVWWQGVQSTVSRMPNLKVISVAPEAVRALAGLLQRTMTLHISIDEGTALVTSDRDSVPVDISVWH